MNSKLAAVLIFAACRSKDPTPSTPSGSGSSAPAHADKSASWATVVTNGVGGLLGLASAGGHTYVTVSRDPNTAIEVDGHQVLAPTKTPGGALIVLDVDGKNASAVATTQPHTGYPAIFADHAGGLLTKDDEDAWLEHRTKGALISFDGSATPGKELAVDGFVSSVTRTSSGTVWAVGSVWGNDDPARKNKGKCDGKQGFVARQTSAGGFEAIGCGLSWKGMHVASSGDDVVMCASLPMKGDELGVKQLDKLDGQTFVARVGRDGVLKWAKAVDLPGDTTCEDVAATSDGDIVVFGKHATDVDHLFLERLAADGTKRWLREFSSVIAGDHPTVATDQSGSVIVAAAFQRPIDLGDGPVGPQNGAMLVTIDRSAKVVGQLVIDGDARQVHAITDGGGMIVGFTSSTKTTVGAVVVTPEHKGSEVIVRVPLPLPLSR